MDDNAILQLLQDHGQRLTRIENKLDTLTVEMAEGRGAEAARGRTRTLLAGVIGAAVGAIPAAITFLKGR